MKKIKDFIFILLLFVVLSLLMALCSFTNAQIPLRGNVRQTSPNNSDTTNFTFPTNTLYKIKSTSDTVWIDNKCRIDSIFFNGNRVITRSGITAGNVGGNTIIEFLNNFFFPTTAPTATINVGTYGTSKEFASAGTDPIRLYWTVTRPLACLQIKSVVVEGKTILPTPNPSEGGTHSSYTDTTIIRNVNKTFTIVAMSMDNKVGSANVTVSWYWKRYWGPYASAYPPTDPNFTITNADILALPNNELSTTFVKNFGTVNTGGNYFIYAFPSAWGSNPKFYINGFETVFVKVKSNWTFTNASGGTTLYDVWCSPFTYGSSFTLNVTN